MTIVHEYIGKPHQISVTATLWGFSEPVVGLHTPTDVLVTTVSTYSTGASGHWTLDLYPNSEIEPPNTVWRIERDDTCSDGRSDYISFISVPATGGPYLAWDLQVPAPGPFPTWVGNLVIGDTLIVNGVNLTPTPLDDLPAMTLPMSGTELVPVEQGGVAVKATSDQLVGAPGDTEWGATRRWVQDASDFMEFVTAVTTSGTMLGATPFRAVIAGTASSVAQGQTLGEYGVADLATGTTTTGRAGIEPNINNFLLFDPGQVFDVGVRMRLPVVSDGTQTWRALIGYGLLQTASPPEGFFLRSPAAAGNWEAVVRRASGDLAVINTGVPTEHGGVLWHTYRVRHAPGEGIRFFIDGVEVAQTNITPNLLDNINLPSVAFIKAAGTTGRIGEVDAFSYRFTDIGRSLEDLP